MNEKAKFKRNEISFDGERLLVVIYAIHMKRI